MARKNWLPHWNRGIIGALTVFAPAFGQTAPATASKKPTLAVLPFIAAETRDNDLAARMRFAVSQKLSTDGNARTAGGKYDRVDNVQVEEIISALQIPWPTAGKTPSDDDVQQVIGALGTQWTITGILTGRHLTLTLYEGTKRAKTAAVDIPSDRESPRLAVEKVLMDLTGTAFAHIRDVEADHSDPAAEKRFALRPNLVSDPGFELAALAPAKTAIHWDAILKADHYAPPLITANDAGNLSDDRVAVIPATAAGLERGYCLMMRMSKDTAENNGLACTSTWIPVEQGKKYRFTVKYHSDGPSARLFLKGFGFRPDQFGGKEDPEAVRRELYRAEILPRPINAGWDLIEMDFTPGTMKSDDPKIEWMRIDLFIYLHPGTVYFDDVVMKKLDE